MRELRLFAAISFVGTALLGTLNGLPKTTIILAEIDPLRSDGELLAEKLEAAAVDVETKTYEGVTHEFFGMGAVISDAKDAVEFAADRLEDAFE